jgi:hypothetical protein
VHDAFTGTWTQQAHVAPEHLNSMRGLNRRFLDLAGGGLLSPGLQAQVAPLSATQRAAAANCPYALFDLRFDDEAYWSARLETPATLLVADEERMCEDTIDFVRLALFYAWHLASSAALTAHLLLGMRADTVEAFRRISVEALPGLARSETANLAARWSGCSAYWSGLIGAAARPDPAALRRVQLFGIQLAAAAQLPSEPREV